MKIVILDGFAANPGDISWEGLKALGECTIYDRTAPEEVLERSAGAEVILTNKVIINADHMAALPELKYIGVLATGYNVVDTAAAKEPVQEELCQIDTIPPTSAEASIRKQIAERNNVSESYVARSEKFMRGVEIMEQMMPGTKEKILSGQFKVRDADMHRLARADFPNRKQIVHEILHPEDRPAPQSSYSHYSGINYSALEVAVRRIQQDFDFLMRYLPKLPDDSYAKTETLKILKQHKAYMAQFEEMLNDKEIA